MTSLVTAKTLLFIALALGPNHPSVILATSNSETYVWSPAGSSWDLKTKGAPIGDWTVDGPQQAPDSERERDFRSVARHDWSEGSSMNLADGSRVEKQGNAAFYTMNPGAPNQKVYTIQYLQPNHYPFNY